MSSSLEVLEADLVVAASADGRVAFEGALGLLGGQLVGWDFGAVVDAAGDDGPVGVAFEE